MAVSLLIDSEAADLEGIGRAAMIAIGVLVAQGIKLEEAVERVSRARGVRVPETAEQLRWLESMNSSTAAPHL